MGRKHVLFKVIDALGDDFSEPMAKFLAALRSFAEAESDDLSAVYAAAKQFDSEDEREKGLAFLLLGGVEGLVYDQEWEGFQL